MNTGCSNGTGCIQKPLHAYWARSCRSGLLTCPRHSATLQTWNVHACSHAQIQHTLKLHTHDTGFIPRVRAFTPVHWYVNGRSGTHMVTCMHAHAMHPGSDTICPDTPDWAPQPVQEPSAMAASKPILWAQARSGWPAAACRHSCRHPHP